MRKKRSWKKTAAGLSRPIQKKFHLTKEDYELLARECMGHYFQEFFDKRMLGAPERRARRLEFLRTMQRAMGVPDTEFYSREQLKEMGINVPPRRRSINRFEKFIVK